MFQTGKLRFYSTFFLSTLDRDVRLNAGSTTSPLPGNLLFSKNVICRSLLCIAPLFDVPAT